MRACLTALAVFNATAVAATSTPACRLNGSFAVAVAEAAGAALKGFTAVGIPLPVNSVVVNDGERQPGALEIEIVTDATMDAVDPKGCVRKGATPLGKEATDSHTVQGACYVDEGPGHRIRCSSAAVESFVRAGGKSTSSPALLYVITHEIAHIYQQRRGEFSGRQLYIELGASRQSKLHQMQRACLPQFSSQETEADEIALKVMVPLLARPPYKEPAFSDQGAMLWNVDRIRLAAHEWQSKQLKMPRRDSGRTHPAFDPNQSISLPASDQTVAAAAQKVVCDVLQGRNGHLAYPVRESTHPAPERRMKRVAKELRQAAMKLRADNGHKDFRPISNLQNDLGAIFTFMDIEYGRYFDRVHSGICSIVNGEAKGLTCNIKP